MSTRESQQLFHLSRSNIGAGEGQIVLLLRNGVENKTRRVTVNHGQGKEEIL
jgi:hypothetical protein